MKETMTLRKREVDMWRDLNPAVSSIMSVAAWSESLVSFSGNSYNRKWLFFLDLQEYSTSNIL